MIGSEKMGQTPNLPLLYLRIPVHQDDDSEIIAYTFPEL